jgi:hypothetical protein
LLDKAAVILPPTDRIECPLCLGEGTLKRTEILDRLGVRDFARVAQLSAEEAFRLLQSKHDREHQTAWSRFETELARRTADQRTTQGRTALGSIRQGRPHPPGRRLPERCCSASRAEPPTGDRDGEGRSCG